ncbi:MAG: ParB/RepB/Spo0J family partition protein [Vicinamibacteria bacterium]
MSTLSAEPDVRIVPVEALDLGYRGLRLPPQATERHALESSLKRHGLQQPLLATDAIVVGALVLVDGFKRVEALAALGVPSALTRVMSLDAPSALAALLTTNTGRAGASDLEEAWVVESLQREGGLSQPEIGELLGRSKTWVCRRLQLIRKLERQVQDDVRLGLIPPATARELARLPRGNQTRAAEAVTRHDLSSRQTNRLVDALLGADVAGRRAILASPLEHLGPGNRADRPSVDARLSEEGNRVRQQLLRLHGAVNRLDELLLDSRLDERDLALLRELAPQILAKARVALGRLRQLLEPGLEETRHAS